MAGGAGGGSGPGGAGIGGANGANAVELDKGGSGGGAGGGAGGTGGLPNPGGGAGVAGGAGGAAPGAAGSPGVTSIPEGGGGGGGGGAHGATQGAPTALAINLSGGAGGAGGGGGVVPTGTGGGGGGGAGGYGVISTVGGTFSLGGANSVTGGAGGAGGAGVNRSGAHPGGGGGDGGAGWLFQNAAAIFTNLGTVTGGAGGAAGTGRAAGAVGLGGAGVDFGGGTLTNAGAIAGGLTGGVRADAIVFRASSTLNLSNGVTLGTMTGGINIAAGTLTLDLNGLASGTVSNIFNGAGGLIKAGAGVLTLSGANTYTGATAVSGGSLIVTSALTSALTVQTGAVFGGLGTTGTLTVDAGGTLSPGQSPGILASGNLSFAATSTLNIEIGGATVGTDYDQVNVTGTVSLGGATLNLSILNAYAAAANATFIIINNNLADAVTGTFNGLIEGANVVAGGQTFRISYVGGDGNDVTLTTPAPVVSPPTPPTPPAPPTVAPTVNLNFSSAFRYQTFSSAPIDPTVTTPTGQVLPNPLLEQQKAIAALIKQVDAGTLTLKGAQDIIVDMADASTSVATMSYQFFTGKIPTKDGLDYLVSSPLNPNDLNDGFYAGMSLENRYINFAVNLGKVGEGKIAFAADYGALSLVDATAKAYAEIFGSIPTAQKLADILTPTRSSYFTSLGGDAIGAKAAMVGFLLGEAAKSDLGSYAIRNENFIYDLLDGAAAYGSDSHIYDNAGPRFVGLVGVAEGGG